MIVDAYTKQILSYVASDSLELDFVLETVNRLIENHVVSLNAETMIHSDQGCHYTSHKFIEIVKNSDLRQSMSRKANCWDNAPQESLFGHMKDELTSVRAKRTHKLHLLSMTGLTITTMSATSGIWRGCPQ